VRRYGWLRCSWCSGARRAFPPPPSLCAAGDSGAAGTDGSAMGGALGTPGMDGSAGTPGGADGTGGMDGRASVSGEAEGAAVAVVEVTEVVWGRRGGEESAGAGGAGRGAVCAMESASTSEELLERGTCALCGASVGSGSAGVESDMADDEPGAAG
jgi:hypothetical protein